MTLSELPVVAGPVLFARGADERRCRLSALVVRRERPAAGSASDAVGRAAASGPEPSSAGLRPMGGAPVPPVELARLAGHVFVRHDFELPVAADARYAFDGTVHPVATDLRGALRIAYVSCNGLERGDATRVVGERNLMWRRLGEEHARDPFALLLHGGDQLYADEASDAHPTLAAWAESSMGERGDFVYDEEAERAATRFFVERYAALYAQPDVAELLARVPSSMMWDDHDIFDGWGSHPPALLDSPVGRGLFAVARRMFLLFQRALAPDEGAPGDSLSHVARFPGFAVVAPDLRSERRPERVMGTQGWQLFERHLDDTRDTARVLLMSSVPLLGPRLSLVERLIGFVPKLRRYEDDLRDQWQSRAHRAEWRRILERLERVAREGGAVTVLSGEIHLASRGEMPFGEDDVLHQLVASGIAHPAPPGWWARALGALAALGEDPLAGRPITLHGLPGRRGTYAAERNYLVLEREDGGAWRAEWELEESGRSAPLALGGSDTPAAGPPAPTSTTATREARAPSAAPADADSSVT